MYKENNGGGENVMFEDEHSVLSELCGNIVVSALTTIASEGHQ